MNVILGTLYPLHEFYQFNLPNFKLPLFKCFFFKNKIVFIFK